MNASEQENIHATLQAMLDELGKLAQSESTSPDDLYAQSADVLRLLLQPDEVAIFLFGVNGLIINVVSNLSDTSETPETALDSLDSMSGSHGEASVIKDSSNRTSILFPLGSAAVPKGVLLLRTKPDGYLSSQKKVVEHVGAILNQRFAQQSGNHSKEDFEKLHLFSKSCMSSLLRDELSETLTNDIRLVLGAERVQYFDSSGNKCRLKNVSSVSRFEKRTSLLQLSEKLANKVLLRKKTTLSCNNTKTEALNELLKEYQDLSSFPFVACFPIYQGEREEADENSQQQPAGILMAEYASAPEVSKFVEATNIVVPQMSMALENAATFSSIPMHKAWLAVYKNYKPRWLRKAWIAAVGLACFLLFVFYWQVDFKIRMHGTLHAVNERSVFSPRDAFVEKVLVDHGDLVEQGQLLLELRSPELQQILDESGGEIAKLEDLRASKKVVLNQTSTGKQADRYDSIRLAGEIAELDFKIQAQKDARQFALQQMEKLKVVSPIDGTVITWDLQKLLHEKPVRWGEPLLKVANENQRWQLQFLAPEKSVGYIFDAANSNQQGITGLTVGYFFSSRPDQEFEVKIAEVGKSTERDAADALGVRVICDVTSDQKLQRHGARVTGDVLCGNRSVAFVWTHELVDAIRRQLVW